jgi:hypothetical protein
MSALLRGGNRESLLSPRPNKRLRNSSCAHNAVYDTPRRSKVLAEAVRFAGHGAHAPKSGAHLRRRPMPTQMDCVR